MTDVVRSPAFVTGSSMRSRFRQAAARLRTAIGRWILATGTRRALDALSDGQLRDIGLTRADIPFVVAAIARSRGDATLDPSDRVDRSTGGCLRRDPPPASWDEGRFTARTFYI
jgi:uncharacterized protein YjiS (DUF1127 family)